MDKLRVGLDIDGVLADFSAGIINHAKAIGEDGFPESPQDVRSWAMCSNFRPVFNNVCLDPDFWLGLPKLETTIDFQPSIYVTARPIKSDVTYKWLEASGFPPAEVVTVNRPELKTQVLRQNEIDVFVDDYFVTVQQINGAGLKLKALLFDAPYQYGHYEDVRHLPKISDLKMETIVQKHKEFFN